MEGRNEQTLPPGQRDRGNDVSWNASVTVASAMRHSAITPATRAPSWLCPWSAKLTTLIIPTSGLLAMKDCLSVRHSRRSR